MPARAKQPTLAPEPWWAKWVLALLKLLLAFALAVLTLLFTRARPDSLLTEPPATQRRAARVNRTTAFSRAAVPIPSPGTPGEG